MLISLRDITKTYFLGEMDVPVLKGVSLDIDKGEYVALACKPAPVTDDDAVVSVRLRACGEPSRCGIKLMVARGDRAMGTYEHVVAHRNVSVGIGVKTEKDVLPHLRLRNSQNRTGCDEDVLARKAERDRTAAVVDGIVGAVTVFGHPPG